MMKKMITVFLIFSLIVSSITPVFAAGFGGGDRGPGWSGGGFGSDKVGYWRDYIAWGLEDVSNRLTTISSRLSYTSGGTSYTVASLLYGIRTRQSDILLSVSSFGGKLDSIAGNLTTSVDDYQYNVARMLKYTTTEDVYTAGGLLYRIWRSQSDVIAVVSPISGMLNTLSVKLDNLADISLKLGDLSFSGSSYDDSALLEKLTSIDNNFSNIGTSPVSVAFDPTVRKIYHVLYAGVNGSGEDMVTIAANELGIPEGSKYYLWYGFDTHVPWCACFVSWCADQCGYLDTLVPKFAAVEDAISHYQDVGLWQSSGYAPSPGDLIFYDWEQDGNPDHVGIVQDCIDGTITTVEGNTGDSPGVVSSRTISVDSANIYGFGCPDYPAGGESIYSILLSISDKLDNLGSGDPGGCNHQYTSSIAQYPTCTMPGLITYTCDLCGTSYSDIMDPLGHDWLCYDHVDSVFDDEGNVLESGYDVYTCNRCESVYYDYDQAGAPEDLLDSTVTNLISHLFVKLGNFVGGLFSGIINLLDKLLSGFDSLVTSFNEKTQQIIGFGGDYPIWLSGIWTILPSDFQLALGFCVLVVALGLIGKKTVFM